MIKVSNKKPVFNKKRIEKSLKTTKIEVPKGLNKEEKREFILKNCK